VYWRSYVILIVAVRSFETVYMPIFCRLGDDDLLD